MQFNTEITAAEWIDDGYWRVFLREKRQDGSYYEYQKEAEILVNNSGTQHKYQWPNVDGLDQFSGKVSIFLDHISSKLSSRPFNRFVAHAYRQLGLRFWPRDMEGQDCVRYR